MRSWQIAEWLTSMSRLADIDLKEFSKLKKEALRYLY
jgi:hypothetical protein